MKWFIPSWNGDFRLEPVKNKEQTRLVIQDPTVHETELLHRFLKSCRRGARKWIPKGEEVQRDNGPYRTNETTTIVLDAPISKVGPVLVGITKPKDRTITALKFSNGAMEVAETLDEKGLEKLAKNAEKPEAKAAASVARPTPCCPQCEPGSIAPATEVLLSFLDEEQHADWAKHRAIIVEGGLTKNRYLIGHRNSRSAQRVGKICYDLDDRVVVHFFDWSVPPEEEVLAAKLILEHREPWLRNEATLYDAPFRVQRFKNPFGDGLDGTETSSFTRGFGAALAGKGGNLA